MISAPEASWLQERVSRAWHSTSGPLSGSGVFPVLELLVVGVPVELVGDSDWVLEES